MKTHRKHGLLKAAALLLAPLLAAPAAAMPLSYPVPDPAGPHILQVQDLCGTIGNCGIGMGGINTIPRHTITPDIGRFDPGHDNRFGRYRYEPPDQQLDLRVQGTRPSPRVTAPRYSGTRTLYRVQNLSAEHVDWCYAKYRSYRAKDNTYQPTRGPRKVCVSPFS